MSKPASGLFHGTTGERAEENNKNTVSMPSNNAQLKHIFRDAPGHLPDTPKNRAMILELANDPGKYVGTDAHGNMWNVEMTSDGAQIWVRYRGGVINNAGKNDVPRIWDNATGLYNNITRDQSWRKPK